MDFRLLMRLPIEMKFGFSKVMFPIIFQFLCIKVSSAFGLIYETTSYFISIDLGKSSKSMGVYHFS